MNSLSKITTGLAMVLASAGPALAVDTSQTYSSGLLVGIFVAFCALIVVFQLMPTLMLLVGFLKGLFKASDKQTRRHGSRA